MEQLSSPFRKRSGHPELPSPQHAGPLVLHVPEATWGALLHAVATALAAPNQSESCSKHHGVEFSLPPEQSGSVYADESEEEIDIMSIDPGSVSTQLLPQPGPAEQVGSCPTESAATDSALAAVPPILTETQQKELLQVVEKIRSDTGRPPPARVSRRLEARRWAHEPRILQASSWPFCTPDQWAHFCS